MSTGGGGGATSSTVYQNAIPEWAQPYATRIIGEAEALTLGTPDGTIKSTPYQQYGGQRIAGLNPLQTQAISGIGGLGPTAATTDAANLAGQVGVNAGNLGKNYTPTNFTSDQFNTQAMQNYMSPYMSGVIGQQKQAAIQDYARQIPNMQAAGIRSGARNSTRQSLLESEARRGLMGQLGGIEASGRQQAYQQAAQQFAADRAARMQAEQAKEQANQFGAGLGLQGLQAQIGAAQVQGGLGQQQYNQQLQALQEQQRAGAGMQGLEQQRLDTMYQDFLNQQRYPYAQLGFFSDILRGVPSATASQTLYQPPASPLGALAGLGGLYMASRSGG
jgi:hypothetical protein